MFACVCVWGKGGGGGGGRDKQKVECLASDLIFPAVVVEA